MAFDFKKYNRFLYGFLPGLMLPVAFMWIYLSRFYPLQMNFTDIIQQLFPGVILGKLMLLSIMPDLALVFVFYKSDSFKIAAGFMLGAMPYLISSIFML
jgi:hypothetical protein